MGLVAREIEESGISTLVHSWMPELAVAVGAPRVVGIGFPGTLPFGVPGDAEGQRAVLRASLEAGAAMTEPGTRVDLPHVWPADAPVPRAPRLPPITVELYKKPWLYYRLLSGKLPARDDTE